MVSIAGAVIYLAFASGERQLANPLLREAAA
jgi:hypothetical protein